MMRPRLVINATNVEMGLGIDRNNPEDRVHLVKILDLIAHATEEAVDRGLEREDVLLWLDTDIGEGALFRAIAKNLHTMLSFDFDSRDEFEVAANDLTDDVDRFKPAALVMPVNNAAAEMGVPNSRSNIRPSELFVSPSPIERHIAIYEYANSFDIPIGWDVRKPRGEWSDALLRSENALRTITIFQDNGLDPSLWILKIPNVKLVTQTIAARTHIDDRNDVLTCFSLEPIFENVLPNQGHASHPLQPGVEQAIEMAATMPGNSRIIVGPESYANTLKDFLSSRCTAADAVDRICTTLIATAETTSRAVAYA